jgi:hypothetical protein
MKSIAKPASMKIDPMLSRHLSQFGSKGGNTRTNNLTPKQRTSMASKAANARWKTKEYK